MVAFAGTAVDDRVASLVADPRVAGVTLYGSLNISGTQQTRQLTADLQRAAGRRLLTGVDQEGGQLVAAGPETTHFAGNMALGAAGDPELARRVGRATGRELAALGINVNYAPVADIASRPRNPSLGIRSFGEDPHQVSLLTAAMVEGIQSAGVAATLKHFPGKGEATVDPHDEMPVLDLPLERLDRVEFVPFRAGIEAGARMVMIGHYGLPAVTGDRRLPASASPAVMEGLVRDRLGFEGVIVTDALDMGGFGDRVLESPLAAGADLLLYGPAQAGNLPQTVRNGDDRVTPLLEWLASFDRPELDVVGCAAHRDLAAEVASRSITLVRNRQRLLPLQVHDGQRILAVMPRPIDLTPADTSSLVEPGLAAAIFRHHRATTALVVGHHPSPSEVSGVREAAATHDFVVVGTIEAGPEQAELVRAAAAGGRPVVAVALRTPYDLQLFPEVDTYVAAYGIHPPSMKALADCLFGVAPFRGRLPVSIPGLYPSGHGETR
jgi:beta-N-acetylhexosaminidase